MLEIHEQIERVEQQELAPAVVALDELRQREGPRIQQLQGELKSIQSEVSALNHQLDTSTTGIPPSLLLQFSTHRNSL